MKFKLIGLFLTVFTLTTVSFAQTNNSVDLVPNWKKDETHFVKIKSTTTDNYNSNAQNYLSAFEARFKVTEAPCKKQG